MNFVKKIAVVSVVAVSLLFAPAFRASAESSFDRYPSSSTKKSTKHKKKKKHKKAKAKHHKAKKSRSSAKPGGPSHYPTQPGGTGSDLPNERKDDLPPPMNPEAGK